MFEEGKLLLFKPFYFADGSSKPKFVIILKGPDANGETLIITLPTSKDHIPSDIELVRGCTELPNRNFNAYVFVKNEDVAYNASNGTYFSFDKNTFVYAANINEFSMNSILQMGFGRTDIIELGKLKDEIFADLKKCIIESHVTKRKFKKILSDR